MHCKEIWKNSKLIQENVYYEIFSENVKRSTAIMTFNIIRMALCHFRHIMNKILNLIILILIVSGLRRLSGARGPLSLTLLSEQQGEVLEKESEV
jgi:hypothetical protein